MTISWKLVNPFHPGDVLLSSSSDADPAYFYSYIESNIFSKFLRSDNKGAAPVYDGEEAETFVEDLAAQVVREAPHKFVGTLLSCLSCAFWKNKGPQDLTNLPDTNPRKICGRVFKVGEVVWTCRQCAKDPTCVQCDDCFKHSDHEGHEVYFHRSAATSGGCCDCGDEEAWAISGNCTKHSHKGNERDPLEALPESLQRGLNAVMKGALGVTISFSTAVVRGLGVDDRANPYTKYVQIVREMHRGTWFEETAPKTTEEVSEIMKEVSLKHVHETECTFCLTLHNDDVHTYDEVTRSITTHVFESTDTESQEKAVALTKMVDQEGFTVVAQEKIDGDFGHDQAKRLNKLHTIAKKLRMPLGESKRGLLTSILPEPIILMEKGVAAYLNWVQDLGKANDGICRLMSNALLMSTEDLPPHAVAMVNRKTKSGVACGICRPNEIFEEFMDYDPEGNMKQEFPIYLKHLSDYADDLNGANAEIQLDANKELNSKLIEESVRLTTSPFSRNCRRNALAVLLMASAYLFKRFKDRISSLVVIYQQDMVFKPVFSQTLTVLYPALYSLFSRYIGTRSDEIFNTTVQVYTANSIVTMMSSDGYQKNLRPLPEPENGHVCIAKMLAHTIYASLLHIGCNLEDTTVWPPPDDRDEFLKAHSLSTQRHQQVFRDFEYVTENIVGNLNLLTGDRDQGLLWIWMAISSMLQGMYSVKRAPLVHVEHEEQVMWHTSTNLTLEMESASTNIISNGLFPSMEALSAESQVASGKDDKYDLHTLQNLAVERASAVLAQGFAQWADRIHARDEGIRKLGSDHDRHEPSASLREEGRYTGSFTCLDQTVLLPYNTTFMRFTVAEDFVSINIPLHRLVAKLFMYSAYNNLDLKPAFDAISSMSGNALLSLADYPLRVMSFAYQVDNRMWVRNGHAVENLAFNYSHGPIVKYLKVMDIHAVQIALIALGEIHGPNQIMALMIDRCGVSKMLEKKYRYFEYAAMHQARPASSWARVTLYEYQGTMLCILLKMLIHVIMAAPSDLTNFEADAAKNKYDSEGVSMEYQDSVEDAFSREVASLVLSGVSSLGQLQVAKAMVGGDKTVNDKISYKVMDRLCHKKAGEGEKMIEPNEETLKLFDPEYTHRSQHQLNKAVDEVRQQRKKMQEKKEDEDSRGDRKEDNDTPLFIPEVVPASNPFFEPVRNLLFTPLMYNLLTRSIELAISQKAQINESEANTSSGDLLLGPSSRIVAERVIYILTVHIHIKNRRRVLETTRSNQWYPRTVSSDDSMMNIDSSAAEESSPRTPGTASSDTAFDWSQAGRLTAKKCGALLNAIADLWHSPLVSDDPLYREGLLWVIKQIALDERNEGAMEIFASRGLTFRRRSATDAGLLDDRKAELQKRKEAAQRSALQNISQQAAAFAAMIDDLTSSDEDEPADMEAANSSTDAGEEKPNSRTRPERSIPKCIVCRESDSRSPIGSLCFLQSSSVVKNAILHHAKTWHTSDPPLPKEMDPSLIHNMYRVVSRKGCFVYKTPEDTAGKQSVRSASIVGRLAHGEHILALRRVSRWVQAVSPIKGWVEIYSERPKTEQEKLNKASSDAATNRSLFDHSYDDSEMALVTNLQSLSSQSFNKHGDCRLHASTCGHHIHYHCWNAYYVSCVHQAERYWNNEYRIALDITAGEFTCPLCKSISNAWLPYVTAGQGELSWLGEDTPDDSKSILPFSMPSTALSNNSLNMVVRRILNTPEIEHFNRNHESQQFVERCIHLHKQAWVGRQRLSIIAESGLGSDPASRREAELIRGVHILAGTIAYTIQSNLLASRWVSNHTGLEEAAQAAFPSNEALEFAAEQLNLIRQVVNWFPTLEAFEESISTPLKFLLGGKLTVPELVNESKDAPQVAPVIKYGSDTTVDAHFDEVNMLRALATSPYNQIVSERSTPCQEHQVAVRRAFFDMGIPPNQLWGFLSVPLLSQDLQTIAVLAAACSGSAEKARDAIALVALARLCQALMEPAVSGEYKRQQGVISSLFNVNETGEGVSSTRTSGLQSLPFRRTASSEVLNLNNASTKEGSGASLDKEEANSTIVEIASLMQNLQSSLAKAAGLPFVGNPEWIAAPARTLGLLLEAWIPFLEYSLSLQAALQCAARRNVPSTTCLTKEVNSSNLSSLLSALPSLLTALRLPSTLIDLLNSNFFQSASIDWATQLSYIQRTQPVPTSSDSGTSDASKDAPYSPHQVMPTLTSRNALHPSTIGQREKTRFSGRDKEFWHETSLFGYPDQVMELISSISTDEIVAIIDIFRNELSDACGAAMRNDGNALKGPSGHTNLSDMEVDEKNENEEMVQIIKNTVGYALSDLADPASEESEDSYQWRLLADGHYGALAERKLTGRLFDGRTSFDNDITVRNECMDSNQNRGKESELKFTPDEIPDRRAVSSDSSGAVKRQRKDMSDATAFIQAIKETMIKKMSRLSLKSVQGHIDTQLDESVKEEYLAYLIDAFMMCHDKDLESLQQFSRKSSDPSLIAETLGRLLVYKAKAKSAKEIGVELKDLTSEGLNLASPSLPSATGRNLKAAAGGILDTLNDKAAADVVQDDDEEEEERVLSESSMCTWKLVGLDPEHRMVDEPSERSHATKYRDVNKNLGHFFTESPFVGSLSGCVPTYDLTGRPITTPWCDLSHMGIFRSVRGGLIELPRVYTDMIQRMRLPYKPRFDELSRRIDEPAICLVCGTIVRAGNRSKEIDSRADMETHLKAYPGECTLHARQCGGGIGVFMTMLYNWVLILNGPRACKYPALYLDKNGEAGEGRGPNRPLQLSEERYKRLEDLYLNHQIASEISRKRLNQDRHITLNYY